MVVSSACTDKVPLIIAARYDRQIARQRQHGGNRCTAVSGILDADVPDASVRLHAEHVNIPAKVNDSPLHFPGLQNPYDFISGIAFRNTAQIQSHTLFFKENGAVRFIKGKFSPVYKGKYSSYLILRGNPRVVGTDSPQGNEGADCRIECPTRPFRKIKGRADNEKNVRFHTNAFLTGSPVYAG